MEYILKLISSLTIAGSIVVGFILLLQLIKPHNISAKWRYTLGKMAITFYIFPIAIIMQWFILLITPEPFIEVVTSSTKPIAHEIFVGSQIGSITEQPISSNLVQILLIIWGLGFLSVIIWQIYCYQKFTKIVNQNLSPLLKDGAIMQKLVYFKQRLGINRTVDIAYSPIIRSPILIGLIKPKIILPISKNLDIDIEMVLHHELVHLKRKDLLVKMLLLVVGALHWFNPFVYILRKDIHIWSELSCDEEVVKEMSFTERKRYGETILSVMAGSRDLPARFCTALSGDGQQLKRRLMFMLNVKKMKKYSIFLTTIALLIIGIIGTTTAVWAANNSPIVGIEPEKHDAVGELSFSNGSEHNYIFEALTPMQQKHVTKEMGYYYLNKEGNVILYTEEIETENVPFEALNTEQKKQVTKELGYYSIAEVKELTKNKK